MKRMHMGITVSDIDAARAFYTKLLGQEPTLVRDDYVKWMVDDPRINLSINTSGCSGQGPGVNHLGIQVETMDELAETRARWDDEELEPQDQNDLVCGYQLQDKAWVFDPHDLPWEVFVTHGPADDYGTNEMPEPATSATTPAAAPAPVTVSTSAAAAAPTPTSASASATTPAAAPAPVTVLTSAAAATPTPTPTPAPAPAP